MIESGSIARQLVYFFSSSYDIIGVSSSKVEYNKDVFTKLYEDVDIRNVSDFCRVCEDVSRCFDTLNGIVYASGITLPGSVKDISIDDD